MHFHRSQLVRSAFAAAAVLIACSGPWAGEAMAQGGTTLQVTNSTGAEVPVMITLGAGYGINNLATQLPKSWNIIPAGSPLKGMFKLPAHSSVSFNSGLQSFSANVSFGPTFTASGCGSTKTTACYPNATNLAEFTLNYPGETVDISGVNGTNALISINFTGQSSANSWNDGAGGNGNITKIANQSITNWSPVPGVFGWAGTNCTSSVNPPNPLANCPAPKQAPTAPQLQSVAQCNIQRSSTSPTGGTVQIVFTGWAPGSQPPSQCN
jgi:hypothetical protein